MHEQAGAPEEFSAVAGAGVGGKAFAVAAVDLKLTGVVHDGDTVVVEPGDVPNGAPFGPGVQAEPFHEACLRRARIGRRLNARGDGCGIKLQVYRITRGGGRARRVCAGRSGGQTSALQSP
ncbi:hypothetical protein G6F23_015402 [Rhizopus arrhizus]|nr:hypothetical protein G6F23_015402 [Rhizopus arrhizus]